MRGCGRRRVWLPIDPPVLRHGAAKFSDFTCLNRLDIFLDQLLKETANLTPR